MKKIVLLFSLFFTTASFAQNVKLVVPDGHAKHVEQCYVSADGKYLATVAYSTVIVWDIQSEKKLYELNVPISSVQLKDYNIQLSKDLKNVLLTCDNGVYYYSLQDGQKIFEEGGGSNGAMLSADEQYVYNMDYNSIELLDAQSGSSVRRFEKIMDGLEYGHGSKFFENTEKNELVVITELGWAVIDLTTGNTKIKKKVSENGNFSGYTYDQKSGTIIGAGDDGLRIYNAYTGVLLKSKKFTNSIFNICLTNDRQLAVIGLNYKAQLYTTELYAFPDLTIAKSTSQKGTEVPESIFYGNVCSTIPGTDKIVFNNNTDLQFYNTKDAAITKAFNNKVTDFKKFYYFSGINQHPLPDSVFALSTEDLGTRVFNTETFRPESFSPGVEWPIWSPNGKLIAG
ncbi:MAG TPA: WD40 repeat domain-containing protein, partial [Panacibacter sp.]|nr:WD40 repeat domain-containing protein [Panacibacter sp.]